MKRFLAVLPFLITLPARADDLPLPVPALFDVTGVAAGDVLNVRALPDASSDVIGSLLPDASAIEVVGYSRASEWAEVNIGDRTGFVALRFLAPATYQPDAYGLPDGVSCYGTEPFWSLHLNGAAVEMTTPEQVDGAVSYPLSGMQPSPEMVGSEALLTWGMQFSFEEDGISQTARILPGRCTDGMSDRIYALHYTDRSGRSGCCSIAPQVSN